MPINHRVTKVKSKKGKIFIAFEETNTARKDAWDEYSLNCNDMPRPEFNKIMEDLKVYVRDICELPDGYEQRITVTGVSYSYNEEGTNWGVVITAQMDLEYNPAPLNINTPYKNAIAISDEMEDCALPADCVDLLEKLAKECFRYINGDRAQGNLFDENIKQIAADAMPKQLGSPF